MARRIFRNLDELEKHLVGFNITSIDKMFDPKTLADTYKDRRMAVVMFMNELKRQIISEVDAYYASYQNAIDKRYGFYDGKRTYYLRTGNLRKSALNGSVNQVGNQNTNSSEIEYQLTFDEDAARSRSIFEEIGDPYGDYSHYEGNRLDLIQGGWKVEKDVWFKNIKHFGSQEPSNIIGKAIDSAIIKAGIDPLIKIIVHGFRNVSVSNKESVIIE